MERNSDLMRDFWDRKAREKATYYVSSFRSYDDQDLEEFWEWGSKLAHRFLEESGIQFDGSENVLEIGCGIGRMTRVFAQRFKEVHGVDVAPEMVSQAKENLKELENATLHLGNGIDLGGFDDGFFDFVFSYIVFQHIPDPTITQGYIREAGRVLKTGGHFYFQVNNMHLGIRSRLRIRSRLKSILKQFRKDKGAPGTAPEGPSGLDHPAWRGSRLTVAQLQDACRSGGLKIMSLRGEGTQYLWVKAIKQ